MNIRKFSCHDSHLLSLLGMAVGALLVLAPEAALAARTSGPLDLVAMPRLAAAVLSGTDVRAPRSRSILVAQAEAAGEGPGGVVELGEGFIGQEVEGTEGTERAAEEREELFDDSSTFTNPAQLPIQDVYIEEALTENTEDLLTTVTITPGGEVETIEVPREEQEMLERGRSALSDLAVGAVGEERYRVTGGQISWRDLKLTLPPQSPRSVMPPKEGELGPAMEGEGEPEVPGVEAEAPTEGHFGAPELEVVAMESIIGRDDRVPVTSTTSFPFRAMGRIAIGCTGTLIGPRHVLTAGHCVYNIREDKWYSKLDFSPGQDGSVRPEGTISWARAVTVEGWRTHHRRDYDYAMIVLDEDIGDRLGTLGYTWQDPMPQYNINVIGYPGDKPETVWGSFCRLEMFQPFRLYYPCDTFGGHSGSAVYVKHADGKRRIYGIHAYGVDSTGFNGATRITKGLFENLNLWIERF